MTIADLVADLRAPTPSAAAELVVNSKAQMTADCEALNRRLSQAVTNRLSAAASNVEILKLSLKDPEILIERFLQRLDDLQGRAEYIMEDLVNNGVQRVISAENSLKLHSPTVAINKLLAHIENYLLRIKTTIVTKVEFSRSSLAESAGCLEALSPLATLQRGYAAVYKPSSGIMVRGVSQLDPGENIAVRLADGIAACEVRQINRFKPL